MSDVIRPRTETVTFGTDHAGKINVTGRGFEGFGPGDQYVATFPTLKSARAALFSMHAAALASSSGEAQ